MGQTIKVGLVAKRHSGKTTLANMLIERGFERRAFADPLKDTWVRMFNLFLVQIGREPTFTREQLDAEKELHRLDLERLGTVHGRRLDDRCWIDLFRRSILADESYNQRHGINTLMVVDDVRFLNEVDALRELGFTIIKITRDEDERIDSIRAALRKLFRQHNPPPPLGVPWDSWLAERERWTDAELEKTLTLPSEIEVDQIEPDICIANTSLAELERHADRIAGKYVPPTPEEMSAQAPGFMAALSRNRSNISNYLKHAA